MVRPASPTRAAAAIRTPSRSGTWSSRRTGSTAFQELIDSYNATEPEYEVEQQVQDWNQIYTKIAGAVQSKTQPDVLFTIPDFTTYVRPLGEVRPVTDLVDELDAEHTS